MDSPFFTNHWNYPTQRPYYYQTATNNSPATAPSTRKVVLIPVQNVGSERKKSEFALKIQKVFRGYLVRKSVKKIAAIRSEVNEIERRLSTEETAELLRRDSKERLRLNETLMNLLFKLDSVRGVDAGVRDCRKSVIKKAIRLQEMIDEIVARSDRETPITGANETSVYALGDNVIQSVDRDGETPVVEDIKTEIQSDPLVNADSHHIGETDRSKKIGEDNDTESRVIPSEKCISDVDCVRESKEVITPHQPGEKSEEMQVDDNTEIHDHSNESLKSGDEYSTESENLTHEKMEEAKTTEINHNEDAVNHETEEASPLVNDDNCVSETDSSPPCHQLDESDDAKSEEKEEEGGGKGVEERKRSRELLEKMMEDNEKMMKMMGELYERNEMQTRLLSSLSQRVEQLERAYICQRLRRKKKNGLAD